MHIGIPLETRAGETRVAATPETVKKYVAQGHQVTVQSAPAYAPAFPTPPSKRPARIGSAPTRWARSWC
jgi:NAD(P) transhydrogenase subunit alpha